MTTQPWADPSFYFAQPEAVLRATGKNGELSIDGAWVVITRKSLLGRLGHSKGDKRISLAAITGVKMRPAGALVNGFIRFDQIGGSTLRDVRNGLNNATADDNAIVFDRRHQAEFDAIRERVERYISGAGAPTAQPSPAANILEQLKGLGDLHSSGVLTDAEFAKKKAELLARM